MTCFANQQPFDISTPILLLLCVKKNAVFILSLHFGYTWFIMQQLMTKRWGAVFERGCWVHCVVVVFMVLFFCLLHR